MSIFTTISDAIKELKNGKPLIVVDSPNRENQGDLILPAHESTVEKINFMIQQCRGFICVPMTKTHAQKLDLPLMVAPEHNQERTRVNFTISVDSNDVTSFGISAADRTKTIQTLADPATLPADLVRPGHVFPLISADGGILTRQGHTEATIELMQLANFPPCGVLCEILREDGEVAVLPDLEKFAKKFHLGIVSISDLVTNRQAHPVRPDVTQSVIMVASATLPTPYGIFKIIIYKSILDKREHAVLILGNINQGVPLTRIHSSCLTGDVFHSLKCDCHDQLHLSLSRIKKEGTGILLYLDQEGRGIGLSNKIRAYALQEKGMDTVEANKAVGYAPDVRDYQIAVEILKDLDISAIRLLTNNPDKIGQLERGGITVKKREPVETQPTDINRDYLSTKRLKLDHKITKV